MPVTGFDHVAITVADVEATLDWYEKVLGAERLHYDLWTSGAIPVALMQIGAGRLSVHPAAAPAAPHARVPTPGSADLCFRFAGSIEAAMAQVAGGGVPLVEGPVGRPASNGERGQSIYVADPDGNLVELLAIEPSGP